MYRLLPMICGVLLIGKSLALAAPPMAPAELPGNGLARHPFFYAGEDKVQSMFLVKDGKIAWSHTMPNSKGEISDAFLRANGNILFAHHSQERPSQRPLPSMACAEFIQASL